MSSTLYGKVFVETSNIFLIVSSLIIFFLVIILVRQTMLNFLMRLNKVKVWWSKAAAKARNLGKLES